MDERRTAPEDCAKREECISGERSVSRGQSLYPGEYRARRLLRDDQREKEKDLAFRAIYKLPHTRAT